MEKNLFNSVQQLKESTDEVVLYGSLGIPLSGSRIVEVPSRSGFVYVRLRDSTSEVIQAQNDAVSPVYDLPVTLVRRGNKYAIKGRDAERYSNWGSFSSFVPRHAEQHSFNPSQGGAGDVVFVYGNQFMPLLTMPSGSNGAGGVILDAYNFQNSSLGWRYLGNTGTASLLNYKPTGSSAVMVLVYLDTVSGNPGFIVGSGSYFSNGITGTAEITPYIPAISNSNWLPSAAIRLVSGTSAIGWDNIYDTKQYYSTPSTGSASSSGGLSGISVQEDGVPQGTGTVFNFVGSNVDVSVSGTVVRVFVTGSSGASLPSFITGSVPYAGANGILKEDNTKFFFEESFGTLWIGQHPPTTIFPSNSFQFMIAGTGVHASPAMAFLTIGTGTNGTPNGAFNSYHARGTFTAPTPTQKDDVLLNVVGGGYDGANWINAARERFISDANWITGSNQSSRIEWDVIPSGSATRVNKMQLFGDSLNLISGTYNVNGSPHSHDASYSFINLQGNNSTGTPNTKYEFSADMVTLRNPLLGYNILRTSTGLLTNDVGQSGTVANGRDQASAFSASSWIHFYLIWNGATLATLSSSTSPPTGPNLPTGYNYWAYMGAVRFDGSSHLMLTTLRGNKFSYDNAASETPTVNATNPTAEQTVDVSTMVPPNALTFVLDCILANTTGGDRQVLIKYISGKNFSAPLLSTGNRVPIQYEFPNKSQRFYWNWNGTGGTSFYATLAAYTMPITT